MNRLILKDARDEMRERKREAENRRNWLQDKKNRHH